MISTATDIFEFWERIGATETIHPADKKTFERLGDDSHSFNLRCLPGHFMGPLKTAPVVMLFMSPGYSEWDEKFAESERGAAWHSLQRKGTEKLPTDKTDPGTKWWLERTKCFEPDTELRAQNIAILNIGAYHSKEMKDAELLAALPSSRVSLGWAQEVLFPQAERGERVVICARAAKFWGLSQGEKYPGTLFAPPMVRGGHMKHGDYRDRAIIAVQSALQQG
jgi:hypothetical protein